MRIYRQILFLLMGLTTSVCEMSGEYRLMADLMYRNHCEYARPVRDQDTTLTVTMRLFLMQIKNVDEKRQILETNGWLQMMWYDEYLAWNSSDYNGTNFVTLPTEKIWLPDVVLDNSADDTFALHQQSRVGVSSNGRIQWDSSARFKSSCLLDVTNYPFDVQNCSLIFVTWASPAKAVNLSIEGDGLILFKYVPSGEWEIDRTEAKSENQYAEEYDTTYPIVYFRLFLKRKAKYFVISIVLPCGFFSVLSLAVFCVPASVGDKITMGTTILVALSVFHLMITERLPTTSDFIPKIAIFLCFLTGLIATTIFCEIFVSDISQNGPDAIVYRLIRVLTKRGRREQYTKRMLHEEQIEARYSVKEAYHSESRGQNNEAQSYKEKKDNTKTKEYQYQETAQSLDFILLVLTTVILVVASGIIVYS